MPSVWELESHVSLLATVLLLGVKVFALVSCLSFSAESFVAAGKLTKPVWAAVLAVGALLQVVMLTASPIHLVTLALAIAAFVYLADVRPALAGLRRR